MQELRQHLKTSVENNLAPFLRKYGFAFHSSVHERSDMHDIFTFTKSDTVYIDLYHAGFNIPDSPWRLSPLLGKIGFKQSTTQFDNVPLWYWKQKIAPLAPWQNDAIHLTVDHYMINSVEEITKSITQIIFDLDNFCRDFLTNDFSKFDRIRQIKYLEYLVQTQVFGEYDYTGKKKFTVYTNKEID